MIALGTLAFSDQLLALAIIEVRFNSRFNWEAPSNDRVERTRIRSGDRQAVSLPLHCDLSTKAINSSGGGATLVNDAPPQFARFPPAFIGVVDPKTQKDGKYSTKDGKGRIGDLDVAANEVDTPTTAPVARRPDQEDLATR